ncbi:MAG: DUF1573 domain-containing protein [Bacteroidaceae bacterium]|nr:DUF1573 domain-containing protein [Bacteroidaceae bacterium]
MNRRAYILACVLWASAVAGAQVPVRNLSRAQIDSLVHPTLHAEGDKVLRADKLSCDLGKMKETDKPVSRTFRLRNVSNAVQRISRVHTTCGCTVAAFDTTAIAPNGETAITLTYNPKNRPGTIDVDAFVYVEGDDRQPMARLSLYGEVMDSDEWRHLPHAMGTLRVKRKEVCFAELPAHGKTSMRVLCANSGSKPLHLTSRLLPPYAAFHTEPDVIAPGEEADLVITIDVDKLPKQDGTVRGSLLIEGIGGKPSERMLQLIIEK